MDVHPPHDPIHTWKDFFLHLATITIGLFIALMLEACVEWAHHRHLVGEARENIRRELSLNTEEAAKNLHSLQQDEEHLNQDLKELNAIRKTHTWSQRSLTYTLNWSSFSDSAWKTSRDTGALSYMEYQKVQALADVYGQQDIVNAAARTLFVAQPQALAPLSIAENKEQTSDANLERIQQRTADQLMNVKVLEQILQQLQQQYKDSLNKF